jgi:hypothetical protein
MVVEFKLTNIPIYLGISLLPKPKSRRINKRQWISDLRWVVHVERVFLGISEQQRHFQIQDLPWVASGTFPTGTVE